MSIFRSRLLSISHQNQVVHPPNMRLGESQSPRRFTSNILTTPRNGPAISSPRPPAKSLQYLKDIYSLSPRHQTKENNHNPLPFNQNFNQNARNEVMTHITYCINKVNPSTQREVDEKVHHLKQIHIFITKRSSQASSINSILADVFQMIRLNLFRQTYVVSPFLLYSDSKAYLTQPLWAHVSLIYDILVDLLKKVKTSEVLQYINRSFITRFVELFSTPYLSERAAVEMVTSLLFEKLPKQRLFMFHTILRMCNEFIQGSRTYICISPCIKYIHNYLRLCPQMKTDINSLTKTLIAPLFSKNCSGEYFEELQNLSMFVCDGDIHLTIWLIDYLIDHYPMTDSAKQCYFLQEFVVLIRLIPANAAERTVSQVFSLIADAIVSENFRVSMCALEIIQNKNFMQHFSQYASDITSTIVPCFKITQKHWCDMVRDSTKEAMRSMTSFDKSAERIFQKKDFRSSMKNRELYNTWANILHDAKSISDNEKAIARNNLSAFAIKIGVR